MDIIISEHAISRLNGRCSFINSSNIKHHVRQAYLSKKKTSIKDHLKVLSYLDAGKGDRFCKKYKGKTFVFAEEGRVNPKITLITVY